MVWAITATAALALYLFLIAPNARARTRMRGWTDIDCAHRGLHGEFPENSLSAYREAADKGFGIELDARLTGDGRIVLMHDDDISRVCGVPGRISQMTLEETRALRLNGTDERVPTLAEALSVVAGRAPVVVEMKSNGREHAALPAAVARALEGYAGARAVESFDPLMLCAFRRLSPGTPRGQLASRSPVPSHRALAFALSRFLLNFLSRPDFIAYEWDQGGSLSYWLLTRVFRVPAAAWTIGDRQTYLALKERFDIRIFERFDPRT